MYDGEGKKEEGSKEQGTRNRCLTHLKTMLIGKDSFSLLLAPFSRLQANTLPPGYLAFVPEAHCFHTRL
jgi:hypothetical protein